MALAKHWRKGGALLAAKIGRQLPSNCSSRMAELAFARPDGACKQRFEEAVLTCRYL